jgi:hypothetical protein
MSDETSPLLDERRTSEIAREERSRKEISSTYDSDEEPTGCCAMPIAKARAKHKHKTSNEVQKGKIVLEQPRANSLDGGDGHKHRRHSKQRPTLKSLRTLLYNY